MIGGCREARRWRLCALVWGEPCGMRAKVTAQAGRCGAEGRRGAKMTRAPRAPTTGKRSCGAHREERDARRAIARRGRVRAARSEERRVGKEGGWRWAQE